MSCAIFCVAMSAAVNIGTTGTASPRKTGPGGSGGMKFPGSTGHTIAAEPGMLIFVAVSRTKNRYPNWPPPRVVGTFCEFLFN